MNYVLEKLRHANWRVVAMAVFAIAILHILTTLAAPGLTPDSAYERLTQDLPVNSMQVLPPVSPSAQPLPFLSPDSRYALCRFDSTDGAVALSVSLPGPGWILALYTSEGDNFFASVAAPGSRRDISLLLVPSDERVTLLANASAGRGEQDKTLTVPAQTGLAILRAPDQGQAYNARNLAELKRARCAFRKL